MRVPMNDLRIQHEQLKSEIDRALAEVIDNCSFVLGPQVEDFEDEFAEFAGARHCIGVSNGTDALKLALRAAGIGQDDEVITTAFTFGATAEAICEVGARPVFVDIDERLFTIDVGKVREAISVRTRGIIPVHLYGQVVDMDPLMELAAEHNLTMVEDAAQAHGGRYKGRQAGTMGTVGCFSFYPGKNLGAYGDAGGLITDDDVFAERLRSLRNHGQDPSRKFGYQYLGYNHRMDGFQGAVLKVKLRKLNDWNERRRQIASRYNGGLTDVDGLVVPLEAEYAYHVYHLYVVKVRDRERLAASLQDQGIATGVYYPHPLHLADAYRSLGGVEGDLPVVEQTCHEVLALPMFPDLSDDQVDWVVDGIRQFYHA